jgi:copper oxidase (laccase) domain-containing protein
MIKEYDGVQYQSDGVGTGITADKHSTLTDEEKFLSDRLFSDDIVVERGVDNE